MFARRDRVELTVLGLLALTWGLVVAPLLHSREHGHRHTHGAPVQQPGSHGVGSVEHLLAIANEPVEVALTAVIWFALSTQRALVPQPTFLAARHRAEQPQAP
jgi:hypothetical protein